MGLRLLKLLVHPPLALFALAGLGALLLRRRPRLGKTLIASAVALLFLLSVPFVGAGLLRSLQGEPLRPGDDVRGAQAIVVLTADYAPEAPEFGGPTVGPLTLERLRYAARLARATGLPVLTSGGVVQHGGPPLAEVAARCLREEFGVAPRWIEGRSGDTWGNARHSADLLRQAGLERALLVTHAWHMPRAVRALEATGLEVVPAPTAFRAWPRRELGAFLPSARGLRESNWALHEWVGRAWYALRGRGAR